MKRNLYLLPTALLILAVLMTACSSDDDNSVDDPRPSVESYETVLDFFKQINAVPRPSHHEEKMVTFLADFAKERNLRYFVEGKNVIIYKDATAGMEEAPGVILQAPPSMMPIR